MQVQDWIWLQRKVRNLDTKMLEFFGESGCPKKRKKMINIIKLKLEKWLRTHLNDQWCQRGTPSKRSKFTVLPTN